MRFQLKVFFALAVGVFAPVTAAGQALGDLCPRIPVPFGPGEEATYQVKFGVFDVGEGRLSVAGVDTLRGHPTYRLELYLEASAFFGAATVKYDMKSWLDTNSIVSRRHTRDLIELGTPRHRFYEIFPEERRWHRTDNDEKGRTLHACPLDDVSFFYYLRAQRFSVAETFEANRYFKEEGNPVRIEVLRKDRMVVPAGTFNTIVIRPTIKTTGLFSENGRAEIHLSDDAYRDVVYMRVDIPVVGSMSLHLKSVRRGIPLRP
jgi:hypothetical protein